MRLQCYRKKLYKNRPAIFFIPGRQGKDFFKINHSGIKN